MGRAATEIAHSRRGRYRGADLPRSSTFRFSGPRVTTQGMKLRHALTLIGLGWYLMVPPSSHNKTKLTIIYEKANDLLLIRYPWILLNRIRNSVLYPSELRGRASSTLFSYRLATAEGVSVSIWYPSWRRLGLIATGAASASATKASAATL